MISQTTKKISFKFVVSILLAGIGGPAVAAEGPYEIYMESDTINEGQSVLLEWEPVPISDSYGTYFNYYFKIFVKQIGEPDAEWILIETTDILTDFETKTFFRSMNESGTFQFKIEEWAEIHHIYYYYTYGPYHLVDYISNNLDVIDMEYIDWTSHENGDYVIFDESTNIFHIEFQYVSDYVDGVELSILGNKYPVDLGQDVIDLSNIKDELIEMESVQAILYALRGGNIVDCDSINLVFRKVVNRTVETDAFKSGKEDLKNKLYLILHDPAGDHSYSGFTQTTSWSLLLGAQASFGVGLGYEVEAEGSLFGVMESGASVAVERNVAAEVGYDVEYKLAQSVTYKSDETSTDREYIGPVHGDHYVGERWYLKWEMFVETVELNDGDHVYVIRKINYGIVRAEKKMGIHDKHPEFPSEWRDKENPAHTKYPSDEVEWISYETMDFGHGSYDLNETLSVTNTLFSSITITLNSEMKVWHEDGIELPIFKGKVKNTSTFSFEMSTKAKIETEFDQQKSIFCHIDDDEPEDIIKMMVGIDKKYGTYIFKTEESSETSAPHEHGTVGNDPPEITLISPLPDSCHDNTVTIEWEAWDFEGDQLSFNIYYMPNNETLWRLVKGDLFGNSYEWNVSSIIVDSVLIKIEAYDEEYTSIGFLENPIYINYSAIDCPRNPIYINYPAENAWAGFDMIFD